MRSQQSEFLERRRDLAPRVAPFVEALRRVTAAQLGITHAAAEKRLSALAEEGRYCREIWN